MGILMPGVLSYEKGSLVVFLGEQWRHPRRQVAALLGVLEPKLVLGQHVLRAELAPLPVHALLLPAEISAHVLVALLQLEGQPALAAGSVHVRLLAVVEQVVGELADVDEAAAPLAVGQQLALGEVVPLDLVEGFVAVLAVLVLGLLFLLLGRVRRVLEGLFVDGLLAVGEVDVVVVVPAALRLLHLGQLFAGLQHEDGPFRLLLLRGAGLGGGSGFVAVELLLQLGVVEAELGVLVLDLGVVYAGVHHVEHALHHVRAGVLDDPDDLLVADEVGERHQQVRGLALHLLVGVFEVAQDPVDDLLLRELLLAVALQQRAHQLQLGDDEFGLVLDVVLVPDEPLGDDVEAEEGDLWQFEVGGVGEFLGLLVGVVEEVEQLVEDVLDEEGHVLEGELDLDVSQPVDEVDDLKRDGRVLGHDDPRQQLDRAHELLLALDLAQPLPHEPQRLLLGPPVPALAQLPHPLGDEAEVRLDAHPQLVLQRQQLEGARVRADRHLVGVLQLPQLVQLLFDGGVVGLSRAFGDDGLVDLEGQLALFVGLERQILGGFVLVEQGGHDLLVVAVRSVVLGPPFGLRRLELRHLDGALLALGVVERSRLPLDDEEAVLRVELLLVLEELLSLELDHLFLLGNLGLNAVAAVVVLHRQRLLLLPLQAAHVHLELLEISEYLLEVGGLLVVLAGSRALLLLLELFVDGPEQRRGLNSFLVLGGRLPCLKGPGVVADFN